MKAQSPTTCSLSGPIPQVLILYLKIFERHRSRAVGIPGTRLRWRLPVLRMAEHRDTGQGLINEQGTGIKTAVVEWGKKHQTGTQEAQSLSWTPPLTHPIILSVSHKLPGPQFPYQ